MPLFQRSTTGPFYYRFKYQGRTYCQSTKTSNRKLAENIETAARAELLKGTSGIETKRSRMPTLREFRERFDAEVAVRHAGAPDTIYFYVQNMDVICDYNPLGGCRLDHIDEDRIGGFVRHCVTKDKLAVATTNRRLATLSKALHMAKKWKLIRSLPEIERLKGERQRDFVLSPEQEQEYFKIVPTWLRDYAEVALDTGMRLSEAIGLRWEDVVFETTGKAKRGYIRIRWQPSRRLKSKWSVRAVAMTARCREALLRRREISRCEYVFTAVNDATKQLARWTVDDSHRYFCDRNNLSAEFVVHSFRHTMLTRLGEAGADAWQIMRIAGHSSVTISQRYVHPTAGHIEGAFDLLETLMESTATGEGVTLSGGVTPPTRKGVTDSATRPRAKVVSIRK